jgi:hypothetical protein
MVKINVFKNWIFTASGNWKSFWIAYKRILIDLLIFAVFDLKSSLLSIIIPSSLNSETTLTWLPSISINSGIIKNLIFLKS